MKKTRQEKAITLVALIITVIVLLILAVVTITAVNDGGIVQYAHNARTDWEEAVAEENTKLQGYIDNLKENDPTGIGIVKVGEKAIKNSTINGKVFSSTNPVIPKGFYAVNVADNDTTDSIDRSSSWDAASGPEVYKGLVITDEVDSQGNSIGSEFVWIPVETLNDFARPVATGSTDYRGVLYDWTSNTAGEAEYEWSADSTSYREPDIVAGSGTSYDAKKLTSFNITESLDEDTDIDTDDLQIYMQKSFNKMVESVAKYKGFYVGRYETNFDDTVVRSIAGETPMNNINWYNMYNNSKTYSISNATLGVTSEMIWGCQWDAMLKFILKNEQDASRVNAKKNVAHTSFNSSSVPYKTGGTNYSEVYTLKAGDTGYVAYNDIASNIYDLEGNVREWTQEAKNTDYRVIRGGYYNSSISPSYRHSSFIPNYSDSNIGSRLSLYVEV